MTLPDRVRGWIAVAIFCVLFSVGVLGAGELVATLLVMNREGVEAAREYLFHAERFPKYGGPLIALGGITGGYSTFRFWRWLMRKGGLLTDEQLKQFQWPRQR